MLRSANGILAHTPQCGSELFNGIYPLLRGTLVHHHLELSIAAPSRAALAVRRLLVHKYPVLSISRYSFIQMSEMKQDILKHLFQRLTRQHRIRIRVVLVETSTG